MGLNGKPVPGKVPGKKISGGGGGKKKGGCFRVAVVVPALVIVTLLGWLL